MAVHHLREEYIGHKDIHWSRRTLLTPLSTSHTHSGSVVICPVVAESKGNIDVCRSKTSKFVVLKFIYLTDCSDILTFKAPSPPCYYDPQDHPTPQYKIHYQLIIADFGSNGHWGHNDDLLAEVFGRVTLNIY